MNTKLMAFLKKRAQNTHTMHTETQIYKRFFLGVDVHFCV